MTEQEPQVVPIYAAVGIAQGLMLDPGNDETRGGIRRGGELVTVSPENYAVWQLLTTPWSADRLDELEVVEEIVDVPDRIAQLQADRLVAEFDMSDPLGGDKGDLRPIPRGFGKGNLGPDREIFYIQSNDASSPPMEVDAVSAMLWWEFDGATSLEAANSRVVALIPDTDADTFGSLTAVLALALLGQSLIHLDHPSMAGHPG